MSFSCSCLELKKALDKVDKAISNRTAVKSLGNIYFAINQNKLKLRGSDLEVSIQSVIDIEDNTLDDVFLINSSTINSIISKIDNKTIHFSFDETKKITIKSGQIGFDLHGQNADDYPIFPDIDNGVSIQVTVAELSMLIKHSIFSASFDETKPFLNGVLIELLGDVIHFVATDGFRLALRKQVLSEPIDAKRSVIVPYKAMNELHRIIQQYQSDDRIEMIISENKISFVIHDFVLISRLIQGKFPDYMQVFPNQSDNVFHVSKRLLMAASERASIIATHSNNIVRFHFGNDGLHIHAVASKMGEFKESVVIDRKSGQEDFNISFNIKLVIDAIKNVDSDDMIITFNDELNPCIFKSSLVEDYTFIVMPIRTSDYQSVQESQSSAVPA